jgi:hypothetical protein
MLWHQVGSSTFEFLHNYCRRSLSKAYMGGGVSMLKSFFPLSCGLLPLFPMSMFGIVNSLLGGREIYQVMPLKYIIKREQSYVMTSCKFVHIVQ